MDTKKIDEKKKLSMEDLENVTGGSLDNAKLEETKPISQIGRAHV